MLEKLLKLLARGGASTPDTLARELGVGRDTLDRMIADLVRLGYLEPVGGACEAKCAGCPSASVCAVGTPQRVWALTEKARRRGF